MTKAKQTTERMKKVTIIANENLYKLKPFVKKCENGHRETLIEFIYETGIDISFENIYHYSSQELAYELVAKGFCVLLYNNKETPANLTVYLPIQISYEQQTYLELATSMLEQYNLSVFQIRPEDEVFQYLETVSQNIGLMMSFVKLVSGNYPKNNNQQTHSLIKEQKN